MSRDRSGGPKPPKRPFKVVRTGESVVVQPTPEQIRQLYMASPHIEWIPFAKSMKWDHQKTRAEMPVSEWITEKRNLLAREQAETLAEMVFEHRGRWHKDVLNTLRDYPQANDAMLGILKQRMNDLIQTINGDRDAFMKWSQNNDVNKPPFVPAFQKIKTSELTDLTIALSTVTQAKHKSLLLGDWSVSVAEQFTDPSQFEKEADKIKDNEWKVEIIGGENLTNEQMQQFLGQWYDKPLQLHASEDLEPDADS